MTVKKSKKRKKGGRARHEVEHQYQRIYRGVLGMMRRSSG